MPWVTAFAVLPTMAIPDMAAPESGSTKKPLASALKVAGVGAVLSSRLDVSVRLPDRVGEVFGPVSTLMVTVLAMGSVSTPLLAVPPVS